MFSGEQSPFMAEVQPPVPLGCEVLMHGEVMATRSLCVLTYKVQMVHPSRGKNKQLPDNNSDASLYIYYFLSRSKL